MVESVRSLGELDGAVEVIKHPVREPARQRAGSRTNAAGPPMSERFT